MVNLISCETDWDLLKYKDIREQMKLTVRKETFVTQETYL
jgi:hypothetical protein